MQDKFSKAEIRKDALQDGVTAASHVVGSVTTIITTAVGDIARTLGGFATEMFEIRDAARKAGQDNAEPVRLVSEPSSEDSEIGPETEEVVDAVDLVDPPDPADEAGQPKDI
jgi:hypothetical protein